jgi:hypothetical protein
MSLSRTICCSIAVLSSCFPTVQSSSVHTQEVAHRQIVSIPAEGLEISEMLLISDKFHSLLFLNLASKKVVQTVETTDSSQPTALKNFNYGAQSGSGPFHLIEHYSDLLNFASTGKELINRPHTISLVDLSSKMDWHGAASVKSMCDYLTDPHRAVTYALCEHNLTVIRTSDDDDAGERLWESTLAH